MRTTVEQVKEMMNNNSMLSADEAIRAGLIDSLFIQWQYKYYAEIFGAQFIRYYAERFTDEERELADQIIEEKKKIYDQVPNSFEIFNMENWHHRILMFL